MNIQGKLTFDPCPHTRFDRVHWHHISQTALMLHNPSGAIFEIGGIEPDIHAQLVYLPDELRGLPLEKEIALGHQAVAAFRDDFERWIPEELSRFLGGPKGLAVQ